jgi:hypothetical protein
MSWIGGTLRGDDDAALLRSSGGHIACDAATIGARSNLQPGDRFGICYH